MFQIVLFPFNGCLGRKQADCLEMVGKTYHVVMQPSVLLEDVDDYYAQPDPIFEDSEILQSLASLAVSAPEYAFLKLVPTIVIAPNVYFPSFGIQVVARMDFTEQFAPHMFKLCVDAFYAARDASAERPVTKDAMRAAFAAQPWFT